MKKITLQFAVLSCCWLTIASPVLAQPSFQLALAPNWATERIEKTIIPYLEQKFSKSTFEFFKGVQNQELADFRDLLFTHRVNWEGDSRFEGYRAKARELREKSAQRGLYLGEWWRWQNDGYQVSEADKKFIDGVDQRLRFFREMQREGSGYRQETESKIQEVEKILARPEFSQSEALKGFKAFIQPQLQGARFLNQEHRLLFVQSEVIDIRNRVKNMTAGSKVQLDQIKQKANKVLAVIKELNQHGYKLNEHKILLDPRDPLSEEWDLQKAQAEMLALSKRQK